MNHGAPPTLPFPPRGRSPWVDGLTIGQVLAATASRVPRHDALVFPTLSWRRSYQQFAADVDAAARGLYALGIRRGENVAVWATNVPEWVVLQFAAARLGAVLVTINPAYRPFELRYALHQCDAVALLLVDRFKTSDYFGMLVEVCPELATATPGELRSSAFPSLRTVVALRGAAPDGALDWQAMIALGKRVPQAHLEQAAQQCQADDAINIQYTSGTTGFPKAAVLSHRNLLLNAYHVGDRQRLSAEDRICIPVPFYHCFGCVLGTLCAAVHGAAMIVPAETFSASATLDAIECERATALYGVPTMFIAELQDESFVRRDFSSLRTGIMAGSPCPVEIMRKVIDRMNMRDITIAYGQTEASPVVTQTRPDDSLELRVGSVGRALPGVEVKIVDTSTGGEVPHGQQGELCARGHVVMRGYYKDPTSTAEAIDVDGWLHTGDLACRLPGGYYRITGRMKDMVIRGGENIYPREIEEFLFTDDRIEQAAVVGIPDAKYGEELCAWVKPQPGATLSEDDIRQLCRRNLAHFKVPRYVRLVDSFPQTVTGKIQKFKIREQMVAELGSGISKAA